MIQSQRVERGHKTPAPSAPCWWATMHPTNGRCPSTHRCMSANTDGRDKPNIECRRSQPHLADGWRHNITHS